MDEVDYRAQYKAAVDEAYKGGVGVYADFDQARQMESYRVLSGDRSKLLKFASREGLTTGHIETLKTLRSPDPLYQMVAQGTEDTKKVRSYLQRIGG